MRSWLPVGVIAASAVLFSLLVCAVAFADAEAYYSGEPKLRISAKSKIPLPLKTTITISNFRVTVTNLIKNSSRRKDTISFTLDIPSYRSRGVGNHYPDRSFSDLTMYVNNKRAPYSRKSVAYLNGTDVTPVLAEVGLRPNDVGDIDRWTENMTDGISRSFSGLKALGLMDGHAMPQWSAKNEYRYEDEISPNANTVFQYTYTALPGIFYISSEDRDRREIANLVGTRWGTLQDRVGRATLVQGFNILRIMQVPAWSDSWQQSVEQLEIVVSMPPVNGKDCLLMILLGGQVYQGEGVLRLNLKKYRQKTPAWLLVYSPFGVD